MVRIEVFTLLTVISGAAIFHNSQAFLFDSVLYHNISTFFLSAFGESGGGGGGGGGSDSTRTYEEIISPTNLDKNIAEDAEFLSPQLIVKYGYPSEIHVLTTDDGYILEMHRIPKKGAPAVLLVHGILDTSATWILMGPNSGLGYLLSNAGYDVWMGNVRGNRYSQKHINITGNEDEKKFWDFSFHEMGVYDLPKMIDHILEESGQKKIHYIGHSQGTAMFWVMCSEKPIYAKKILSMHALAPIAFLSEMWNPFVKTLTLAMDFLDAATSLLNINQLLPNTELIVQSSQKACHDKAFTQQVCSNLLFLIAGFNSEQLNKTMLPVILSHTPSGASAKQFIHFGQLIRSGRFQKFNYGFLKNIALYAKFIPPDYKLSNVDVPVALYYAENDWLVSTSSVDELAKNLPNVIDKYLVKDKQFNHLDFVWAVDAKKLLYNRVIDKMKNIDQVYL